MHAVNTRDTAVAPEVDPTVDIAPGLALPWVIRLRYGMALGETLLILFIIYRFGFDRLTAWTFVPVAVVLSTNLLLQRFRSLTDQFPEILLGTAFLVDIACLTAVLALTGGPTNPFSLFYLVQITLSAVVLRGSWPWVLGALSSICFGALFLVHASFAPFGAHHEQQGLTTHLIGMWVAFVAAAALIAFFTGKISEALSLREQEIRVLQERVAKNDRLASLATLSAGAAHELGTPLATIAVVSKELEHYASTLDGGGAVAEDARLIRSEIERCRTILHRMSADGGEPVGEAAQRVTAAGIASETLGLFPESERARIIVDVASQMALKLPVQAIVRSLAALVQNALDAAPDQSEVVLRVVASNDRVRFEVIDRGAGIAPDVLKRISEPFFTTKPPSKGMGLGTFLVRLLAERLGGDLSYESRVGHGTRAILSLPLSATLEGANVSA